MILIVIWAILVLTVMPASASNSNIKISNVRPGSFAVSWISTEFEKGEVCYGIDEANLNKKIQDVRLSEDFKDPLFYPDSTQTHLVLLKGLEYDTRYAYKLSYCENRNAPVYTFQTPPAPSSVPSPSIIQLLGRVTAAGNVAKGALVHFYFKKNSGYQSSRQTAFVYHNTVGTLAQYPIYADFTSPIYSDDLSQFYYVDLQADSLFIEILGGDFGTYKSVATTGHGFQSFVDPNFSVLTLDEITLLRGDINLDGVINDMDATLIAGHILGMTSLTGQQFIESDLNHDTRADIYDLLLFTSLYLNR